MKLVFKFAFAVVLAVSFLGLEGHARAEATYFTTRSVLKEFFPNSDKVTFIRFTPTRAQRARIAKKLGYALPRTTYVFYVALSGDEVDGYAFVDEQMGQHLPISFIQ